MTQGPNLMSEPLSDQEELPGVALTTGMRRLSANEQERARESTRRVQRKVAPFIDEAVRLRHRAEAEARNAWIG